MHTQALYEKNFSSCLRDFLHKSRFSDCVIVDNNPLYIYIYIYIDVFRLLSLSFSFSIDRNWLIQQG